MPINKLHSNEDESSNLFKQEDNICRRSEEIIRNKTENISNEEYSLLAKNYKKLLKQTKRLIRIGDMQQLKLDQANKELSEKNQQITDSIYYARRIQQAMLPSKDATQEAFGENAFVIYRPHSIVSGDFYWLTHTERKILIAAIDCTGHGVSGAFLSMIGNTLLNKIVLKDRIHNPARILEQLHRGVRSELQQETGNISDGMDVCLCCIDGINVTFAGAKRPLYYFSQQQLQELKGDRKSIGGRQKEEQRTFTNQEIILNPGDTLYLSSDGIADQPNPQGKRFGSRRLKALLNEIAPYSMTKQEHLIRIQLEMHQQDELQRDDITLLGVRV